MPCRLITTYAGKGTEWLEFAVGNNPLEDACSPEPGIIRSLDEGDIALFKGERWEGNEGRGVIHRSPKLAANEARLLLTLDFV